MWTLNVPLPTYEEWHFIEITWTVEYGIKVRYLLDLLNDEMDYLLVYWSTLTIYL